MPPFEFRRSSDATPFLSENDLRPLLRLEDLIPAMEKALIDFSSGHVIQPVRRIVPVPQYKGLMGSMPAVYGDVMGAKLVNVYPKMERATYRRTRR